jgi:site-specific DNA recombinase
MRYFIYCRKSSEAEDRQIASIESQLTTLERQFIGRSDVEIVGIYQEAFSAKAPGRPKFNEMIERVEQREADGIVAWAPDRLARNSIDGGRLIYMLDTGKLRDLKFATYTFENNSQGKFMLQIMFGQSKYYSDALSDNVKRGNRTKVENGWRPGNVPVGYINDPVTRTIVRDPERFEHTRQMFQLLLAGKSPRQIWNITRLEWDFRTRKQRRIGGKHLALGAIYKLLNNPFYAGVIVWNGRQYPGAHEPMISWQEFERVKALLVRSGKRRPKRRSFPFTGVIRCGECGFMVTAEEKINRYGSRYTYYHCSKRRPDYRCYQPSVQVIDLENQISFFLDSVTLPVQLFEWANKMYSNNPEAALATMKTRRLFIEEAMLRNRTALNNLTAMRIRDMIDDSQFLEERATLEAAQIGYTQELQNAANQIAWFEPFEDISLFRNRAIECFRNGDDEIKRLILKTVGSNPTLTDRKLNIQAKKPFRPVHKSDDFLSLRAFVEDVRTSWIEHDPELQQVLENIRTVNAKLGIRSSSSHLH